MVFVTARFAVLAAFISLAAISQNPLSVDAAALPRSDVTNAMPAVREEASVMDLPPSHHKPAPVSHKGKKTEKKGDKKKEGKKHEEKHHNARFASPGEEPVAVKRAERQAYFDRDGTSTHAARGRDHDSEHARAHGGHGSHRKVIVDGKSNHARVHRRSPDHDHDHDHEHKHGHDHVHRRSPDHDHDHDHDHDRNHDHDHDHTHTHDHDHDHDHDHHRRSASASGKSFLVSPAPKGHSRRSPSEFTKGDAPQGIIDLMSCGKPVGHIWVNETTKELKAEPSSKNQTNMYLVETGVNGAHKTVEMQLPVTDTEEAQRFAYCLTYCARPSQPQDLYFSPCEQISDDCSQTFLYNGTDGSLLPMSPGSSTTSGPSAETANVGGGEEDGGDEEHTTDFEKRNETSTNVALVFVPSGPVANVTDDANAEDDSDASTVTVTETQTTTVTATVTSTTSALSSATAKDIPVSGSDDSTTVTTPTSIDSSRVPSATSSSLKVEVYALNAVTDSDFVSSQEVTSSTSSTTEAPPSTSTDPVQVASDRSHFVGGIEHRTHRAQQRQWQPGHR
ncbi:hypothetical protein EV421DRAFT_1094488 [Armillaria borealis]|uniref:Uncharacterized protein n=1 Tax=Armillaria borealis TaxID=47425 RepID=A0AA39J7K3_9AGAR|nr:hypothetical protein EV421DRAFT_1094488 [Armillaria borealis]